MSTAQLDRYTPRIPGRTGQGTAVEQSRAVAEVEAAIVVAQRVPRQIDRAVADMHRSCNQRSLAEKAFFKYSRGGSSVSGSTIQLARELARCWGNVQYGLTELRRDDEYGQSEMQAWCWDVQTNARSSTTFIVPHLRDKTGGPVRLTDMRDIYENNANMGARRLREMIFAILPGWYAEDAVAACYETLAADDSDGATIAERAANMTERFAKIGITAAQIVQKLGAPQNRWTPYDLAQMSVTYRSIMRGETRKEDEFESAAERTTAADITGQRAPAPPPADQPAGTGTARPARSRSDRPTGSMLGKLGKLLIRLGIRSPEDTAAFLAWQAGRPGATGLDALTRDEVAAITATADKAIADAEGDTEEAASRLWTAYRQEQDEAQGERQDGPELSDDASEVSDA